MTELTINTSGRKKLVITKVLEKRKVKGQKGEFDVLDFLAKVEGEDAGTKYQVSFTALFEFIKPDTTIDCDVVVTEQKQIDPDGNPYRNRKITQIYKDGKPVKEQQQGGRNYGKSPEIVAMEIDSKFRDTALMQACIVYKDHELGKNVIPTILACANEFYAWLKGEKTPEKPVVKAQDKETPAPAQQEATLPIVGSPSLMSDESHEEYQRLQVMRDKSGMPASIKTGAQMASYAGKRGIDSVQFTAITQAANPNDLKTEEQLIAAWNVLAPKMKGK